MPSAHDDLQWDDLRFALAIARTGSLSGAARALAVNHTTVSRRLAAIEKRLGVRLFERMPGPSGWTPTEAGEALVRAAERVEEQVDAVGRQVLGGDARLSGEVRIAVSDIWCVWLMPIFEEFGAAYPEIELQLVAGNAPTNLTQREADVALRVTDAPPEHLVGRKTTRIGSAIYASKRYLERNPVGESLVGHRWIAWDESTTVPGLNDWLRAIDPDARIACRVNSGVLMQQAMRAGMGLGRAICPVADADPDLVRLTPPTLGRPLWLLTHRDLRHTGRIRAILDFLAERLGALRREIEGAARA